MDTVDSLTKSFDKLVVTTIQNILGNNLEVCKWSFVFTSIGIGINILLNSFYFMKINNENNIIKNKINLLINENKLILEGNITIYETIKNNTKKLDSLSIKNTDLLSIQNTDLLNDIEASDYDFLYCE